MSPVPPSAGWPRLGPADVHLHAHDSGAISVRTSECAVRAMTLPEVLALAGTLQREGGQVHLARDAGDLPASVADALRAAGIQSQPLDGAAPLRTWGEGTDALMEAAAAGDDVVLADLLDRGSDVHRRDASGSTALHHAAARGRRRAVDALVAAGAEVDAVNVDGFTPRSIARAARQDAVADRLVELGAGSDEAAGQAGEPVTFARTHAFSMWYWALLPVPMLVTAIAFLWPLSWVDLAVVLAVGSAYVWALPPRAYWAGGVPRALAGDRLLLRTLGGRTRSVDLADVSAAALGGTGRSVAYGGRTLVLDHPDGIEVDRKQLARLGVPPQDLDAVAERIRRAVVVSTSGAHREEVVLAVGNRLSALGVDLAPNLRRQLAAARRDRRAE